MLHGGWRSNFANHQVNVFSTNSWITLPSSIGHQQYVPLSKFIAISSSPKWSCILEIHEWMSALLAKAIYIVQSYYIDMTSFELVQPPQGPVRRSISPLPWLNMQSHPQANHTWRARWCDRNVFADFPSWGSRNFSWPDMWGIPGLVRYKWTHSDLWRGYFFQNGHNLHCF